MFLTSAKLDRWMDRAKRATGLVARHEELGATG